MLGRLVSFSLLAAGTLLLSLPAAPAGTPASAKRAARRAAQVPQRIPRQAERRTVSVQGVIRNESGRGIPDVTVSLRRGSERPLETSTNGEGIFRFREVPPGAYRVQLLKPGFETLERSGLALKAGENAVWEFTLKSMEPLESSSVTCGPAAGLPKCPEPGAQAAEQQPSYRELRRRTAEEAAAMAAAPPLPDDSEVFIPEPDRWKIPYPNYHRYPGKKGDVVYVKPHWYDPFNVNTFKGDRPIIGNKTFFAFTGVSESLINGKRVPLPSNVASARPGSAEFFGRGEVFTISQNFRLSFELFHGTTQAFRPVDWRIKVTPVFNLNYLHTQERGIVNIDVRKGTTRFDTKSASLQEAFFEYRIKDLSPNFDVLFLRLGIQQFTSDFRGFLYVNEQPGVRIFGNWNNNKWEYNLAYFNLLEKDSNSDLNILTELRHQQVFIANVYKQDFFHRLGYTAQFSVHLNKDQGGIQFDKNDFLVRPAPIGLVVRGGVPLPHDINTVYLGWTGQGHFGRLNVSHAFYQVLGEDTLNPIAGRSVTVNAQMVATELSIDKDWLRLRGSFFWASGDGKPRDGRARGFDSIVDNPVFVGGIFSFWNREGIRLTGSGVALTSGGSLLPALRSANLKDESQSNFVNPGIFIYNAGMDIELTQKLRTIINVNYLRFQRTEPLELLLFQAPIRHSIGLDYSIGFQYRPPLTDNIVILFGASSLQPGQGFRDIYTGKTLWSVFTDVRFLF